MKRVLLHPLLRNFYFVCILAFSFWMLFFDGNDLYSQYKVRQKLAKAEEDKRYYLEKIVQVNKDKKELMGTPALLEKYAREQYLMKKKNENLYIVEDEAK